MSKTDIWLPLYVGDYLSDTMHLTTEEHGAYLLLIMYYWKNRGPIKADPHKLASICKMSLDAWSMLEAVLMQFFDTAQAPGFWVHHRLERELSAALQRKKTAEEKARNAAMARHNKKNVNRN